MNQKYQDTKLPDALEQTVRDACARGAREVKRRRRMQIAGVAVAACAAVVITANVPPVASALRDVPLLGSLVRVLQIGDGGERTDGVTVMGGDSAGSAVRLTFQRREGASSTVPAYTVQRAIAPNRIIFTLNGVRGFDLDAFAQSLSSLPEVRAFHHEVILDDSAMRFSIELAPGVGYEVSEYREPGYMDLRLFADESLPAERTVYFLRSNAMPRGESLALLAEMYVANGATVAPTQTEGQYVVQIGAFGTEAEAQSTFETLGSPAEFWVDSCLSNARPQ